MTTQDLAMALESFCRIYTEHLVTPAVTSPFTDWLIVDLQTLTSTSSTSSDYEASQHTWDIWHIRTTTQTKGKYTYLATMQASAARMTCLDGARREKRNRRLRHTCAQSSKKIIVCILTHSMNKYFFRVEGSVELSRNLFSLELSWIHFYSRISWSK